MPSGRAAERVEPLWLGVKAHRPSFSSFQSSHLFVCLATHLFIVLVSVIALVFILWCSAVLFGHGLHVHTRLALAFQSRCLLLPSARITGMSPHSCLLHPDILECFSLRQLISFSQICSP